MLPRHSPTLYHKERPTNQSKNPRDIEPDDAVSNKSQMAD